MKIYKVQRFGELMVTRAYLLQQEVGMKSFLSYGLTSSVVLGSLSKVVMSSHTPSLLELTSTG